MYCEYDDKCFCFPFSLLSVFQKAIQSHKKHDLESMCQENKPFNHIMQI